MRFGAASAWAHSDIFLSNVGGQVNIGGANELETIDENFDLTSNVVADVLIPSFPPFDPKDYGRDEPGFFALASGSPQLPPGALALPRSTPVTINQTSFSVGSNPDTLFYWNGSGAVNFQPISVAQPGVTMLVDPDPIGTTAASGSLHEHAVFELDNGAAGVPADGVYLISPTASVAGLNASKPSYMVFLADALISDADVAEELEAALETDNPVVAGKDFTFFLNAVDYVHDNLAVPEPSCMMLSVMALTSLVAAGSRRRKR